MSVHDCLVGALLALASGKAERRQVHPPGRTPIKNLPRMSQMWRISSARSFCEFGEFCGRIFSDSRLCGFCEFCGRIGRGWRGGRVKTPNINN